MVLDKLGASLKETLSKIAKSVFVDEKLINELVKDIQRALLQADVNVSLVFDLTKKIKERSLKEDSPKGLTKKEYLIRVVYEELANFLGGEAKAIDITKKPTKIMMVGLFGSGKCVHPKSNIILSDGTIISAEDLYKKYKSYGEKEIEEGVIVDVSHENLLVPSFNPQTLRMENKQVTYLWKLKGKKLLEVNLDNGNDFSVKVTPEHPFFALRKGMLTKIRADELNGDDFVAIPRKVDCNGKLIDLYPFFKHLNLLLYDTSELIKQNILAKYPSLKEAYKQLRIKRNYPKFTSLIKQGIVPLEMVDKLQSPIVKLRFNNASKPIFLPRYLTNELSELLGYVIGDGYINKRYIEISNEDEEIINRVCNLSRSLFGLLPEVKRDKRTKKMYTIRLVSTTLVKLLCNIFGFNVGKKGNQLKVPQQITQSGNDVIRLFLRAYFDCDSYVSKIGREIELVSESKPLIKQISALLLRFSIISTISVKSVNGTPYWRLYLRGRYAEEYVTKIGFLIKKKLEKGNTHKQIGIREGCGKQDMIPVGNILKEFRYALGLSIGEVQEQVNSYGLYEKKGSISRESLSKFLQLYPLGTDGKMLHIMKNIHNQDEIGKHSNGVLNAVVSYFKQEGFVSKNRYITAKGEQMLHQINKYPKHEILNYLICLSESDVCWARVNSIKQFNNNEEYVYDLTVNGNHSFIADNIIVHNTTTIGKLAKYYAKRGHKVAAIGLDVHRPAASDQLEQVCKSTGISVFVNKKEKNALKIYQEFEKELNKFNIVLVDTAGRDALSEDLIKEITELNEKIKPHENLLVISADIGQAAQKQAAAFHSSCGITGIIATKMDGTAKAGGALSACATTKAPIKFIGVGEKLDDLESFKPKNFVGRLLGMGDLEALLEKAEGVISEQDAQDLGKKFLKGDFNLIDLYEQMRAVKKMGSLKKITEMIPGFGQMKLPEGMLDVQEEKIGKWRHAMDSMTKSELEDPEIIDRSRIERISKGSGISSAEVRELLKQYRQSKKMVKMFKGADSEKGMQKMMRKLKGKIPGF